MKYPSYNCRKVESWEFCDTNNWEFCDTNNFYKLNSKKLQIFLLSVHVQMLMHKCCLLYFIFFTSFFLSTHILFNLIIHIFITSYTWNGEKNKLKVIINIYIVLKIMPSLIMLTVIAYLCYTSMHIACTVCYAYKQREFLERYLKFKICTQTKCSHYYSGSCIV